MKNRLGLHNGLRFCISRSAILVITALLIAPSPIYAQTEANATSENLEINPASFEVELNTLETSTLTTEIINNTNQEIRFSLTYPESELIDINGTDELAIQPQTQASLEIEIIPTSRSDYSEKFEVELTQELENTESEFVLAEKTQTIELDITSNILSTYQSQRTELLTIAAVIAATLITLIITSIVHIRASKK